MKYNILIILLFCGYNNVLAQRKKPVVIETPKPKPKTTTKPKSPTPKPTTPTWKTNFDKKFTILKSNENSYLPQIMIDKYTTLLNTLPSAAKTEKELIYARIELLKTKIDISGTWNGVFTKYPLNYYDLNFNYDINLKIDKQISFNKFSGKLSIINDSYFGEYNVSGLFCNQKHLEFSTIELIKENQNENWIDCINFTFELSAEGTEITFADGSHNFSQKKYLCNINNRDTTRCIRSAYLRKSTNLPNVDFDKKWEQANSTLSTYIKSIKIGTQIWSVKNLDVAYFRNGDPIPEVKTNEEWKKAGENKQPAWCYYNNDPANGKKYGKLYNWYAVNDKRGLAPAGWHIPSDKEWQKLVDYLGGKEAADGKMKSTSYWESPNNGATNSSGFTGLPAGYRYYNGPFDNIGYFGYFWSSTEYTTGTAWYSGLHYNNSDAGRNNVSKENGFSVRCVRD
jgi:uncharacterized protein (TIGR02145 family)